MHNTYLPRLVMHNVRMITKMGLTKGMSSEQILAELKGCISGETDQEVVSFKQQRFEHIKNERGLHEVLLCDDKYALIRKNNYKRIRTGELGYEYEYYLCGVNDEQTYFLKKLDNFENDFTVFPSSVQEIVSLLNKSHLNYERIQGDILYKQFDFSDLFFVDEDTLTFHDEQLHRIKETKQTVYTSGFIKKKISEVQTVFVSWDDDQNLKIFGNHILSTDGVIFVIKKPDSRGYGNRPYRDALETSNKIIIVKGTWLRLEHNQHNTTKLQIPESKAILLEPQIQREFASRYRD